MFTEIPSDVGKKGGPKLTWLDGHVIPGLIESHGHMLAYGESLESVDLFGSTSVKEMRERIKSWLKDHKGEEFGTKKKWLRGVGWDQKYFGGVMPTAVSLIILCETRKFLLNYVVLNVAN